MSLILLRTTLATLIAFGGGALGVALGKMAQRHLNLLVGAAMIVLLAVTLFDVLPDAKAHLTWPEMIAGAVSGYGLFWLISRHVYHICPACAATAFDAETTRRLGQTVMLLMIALGIHSAMDGVAIAVGDEVTGHPNPFLLFAVSFHKLPEGLALALLLLGAGYRRRAALLWTWGIESTTELGGLLGVFVLRGLSPVWLCLIFAHVGGGFLYLAVSAAGMWTRSRLLSSQTQGKTDNETAQLHL